MRKPSPEELERLTYAGWDEGKATGLLEKYGEYVTMEGVNWAIHSIAAVVREGVSEEDAPAVVADRVSALLVKAGPSTYSKRTIEVHLRRAGLHVPMCDSLQPLKQVLRCGLDAIRLGLPDSIPSHP